MQDTLHQQYRAQLFPYCEPIVQAALKAGAHGAFLSGAGPVVVAITGGVGIASATQRSDPSDAVLSMCTLAAGAASSPTPGGHCWWDRVCADIGSDTMSQFLAEAVSRAMHESAQAQGVAGSLHIAEPSAMGFTSAGYDAKGEKLWGVEDH
jgi:hypothetical protein